MQRYRHYAICVQRLFTMMPSSKQNKITVFCKNIMNKLSTTMTLHFVPFLLNTFFNMFHLFTVFLK